MNREELVKVFKAFADENRLQVLWMLKDGEKCACKLQAGTELSQSGLSYHMKILQEAGLVKSWPVGTWTHYELDREGLREAVELLESLIE